MKITLVMKREIKANFINELKLIMRIQNRSDVLNCDIKVIIINKC